MDQPNPVKAQLFPYEVTLEPGEYSWCACGESTKQPFCDGTHKVKQIFKSLHFTLTERKTVHLCGCKSSKNPPYCDGSHHHLGE